MLDSWLWVGFLHILGLAVIGLIFTFFEKRKAMRGANRQRMPCTHPLPPSSPSLPLLHTD